MIAEKKRILSLSLAEQISRGVYPTLRDLIKNAPRTIYPECVDLYPPLKVLMVDNRRVTRTLGTGKTFRYRVAVAVGGNGILGVGVAKGKTVPAAREKAIRAAKKKLILMHPCEDRGYTRHLPLRPASAKMGATMVTVIPLEHGTSVTSSKYGQQICRLAGITNLCIRVGNKGRERKGRAKCRVNYATALHEALRKSCE